MFVFATIVPSNLQTMFHKKCGFDNPMCVVSFPPIGITFLSVFNIVLPSARISRAQHTAQPFMGRQVVQHLNSQASVGRQCLRWLRLNCQTFGLATLSLNPNLLNELPNLANI